MPQTSLLEPTPQVYPRSLRFFLVPVIGSLIPPPIIIFVPFFRFVPFLSLTCLWLGLVGIAYEALSGRVSRIWFLPLFGVFGVYYAVAALEHQTFARVAELSAQQNADVQLDFDPQHHALIAPQFASELVRNYGVPVVWREDLPRSFRLIDKALCAELGNRLARGLLAISLESVNETVQLAAGEKYTGLGRVSVTTEDGKALVSDDRFCLIVMPERTELPTYRVQPVIETAADTTNLEIRAEYLRILSPNGEEVATIARSQPRRKPLPLWPDLGAFCARILSPLAIGGGCIDFHNTGRPDAGSSFVPGIAQALGLAATGIEGRRAADPGLVRAKFEEAVQTLVQQQIDLADIWIEGRPKGSELTFNAIPPPDLRELALDPEALRSRGHQIMTALENLVAMDERDLDRQSSLEGLLSTLPADALGSLLPRIDALKSMHSYEIRHFALVRRIESL